MNKKGFVISRTITLTAVVALFISLFSYFSIPSATASANITRHITVKGSNGSVLPGALVQVAYSDESKNRFTRGAIATTDINGKVDITFPDTISDINILIEPAENDSSNAIGTFYLDPADQDTTFTLATASTRIHVLRSDGSEPNLGAYIEFGKGIYYLLRTGPFNINLSSQSTNGYSTLTIYPTDNENKNQFSSTSIWRETKSNGISEFRIYKNDGTTMRNVKNLTFEIPFELSNISGTILKPDGTKFVASESVTASINFYLPGYSKNPGFQAGTLLSGESTWNSFYDGGYSGKIAVVAQFNNSLTFAETPPQYFWTNGLGQFSLEEFGTYSKSMNLTLQIPNTTPNFQYQVVDSDTASTIPSYISISNSDYSWYRWTQGIQGNASLSNDSVYNLDISPQGVSDSVAVKYIITLTGSTISVKDDQGIPVISNNGIYKFNLPKINFKYQFVDSLSHPVANQNQFGQYLLVNPNDSGWIYKNEQSSKTFDNTWGLILPEGNSLLVISTYRGHGGVFGDTRIQINKTGNKILVNGVDTLVNGVYQLPLKAQNVRIKIVDPIDLKTPLTDISYSICAKTEPLPILSKIGCLPRSVDSLGQGGGYVPEGDVVINVSGNYKYSARTYAATMSQGVLTFPGMQTDVDSRIILMPAEPNLIANILGLDGSAYIGSNTDSVLLGLQKIIEKAGNIWQTIEEKEVATEGTAQLGFNLTEQGTYRIKVSPSFSTGAAVSYSPNVYVDSSGNLSRTKVGGYVAKISNFNVQLTTGNVKLQIVNPIDFKVIKESQLQITTDYKSVEYFRPDYATGKYNLYLPEGTYYATADVYNTPGLDSRTWKIQVASNGSVVVSDGEVFAAEKDGFLQISPYAANLSGRIVDQTGSLINQNKGWVQCMLEKKDSNKASWFQVRSCSIDSLGNFALRFTEPGRYRFHFIPNGNPALGDTKSEEFDIPTENPTTFSKHFEDIRIKKSQLVVKIKSPGNPSPINYFYSQLFKVNNGNDEWVGYLNSNSSDSIGITVDSPGTYGLKIFPPGNVSTNLATPKRYTLTAVEDQTGTLSLSADAAAGVEVFDSFTVLSLGVPTAKGKVVASDGTTPVAYSSILVFDKVSGYEIAGTQTDSQGFWGITLPEGKYQIFARPPYNSIEYGYSNVVEELSVDANGAATAISNGQEPSNIALTLTAPTWAGVIKEPIGDSVVPFANVCLTVFNPINNIGRGDCQQSDAQGRWALSVMPGYTISSSNSQLNLYSPGGLYPNLLIQGGVKINEMLGAGGAGIVLRFPEPNVRIIVTAGGLPVPQVQVGLSNPARGWLGSQVTNAQGEANLYVENISDPITASVYIGSWMNLSDTYVSTSKFYSSPAITSGTIDGVFNATLELAQPNVKAVVNEPAVSPEIAPVHATNGWVEIFNETTWEWVQGTQINLDGSFKVFLDPGCSCGQEYTMTMVPWNPSNSLSIRKSYKVLVDSSGVASVYDKQSNELIAKQSGSGIYTFNFARANVTGVVVSPTETPIANTFVNIWPVNASGKCDRDCWKWTQNNGVFGFNLVDGQYSIGAEKPYWSSDFVASQRCLVTIDSGTVTGDCVQPDGTVKLSLREPNLKMTLSSDSNPVPFAGVSIRIGNWSTWAQGDSTGRISIYLDEVEIQQADVGYEKFLIDNATYYDSLEVTSPGQYTNPYEAPGTNLRKINVSVYPQWNASNAVRWNCVSGDTAPICNLLESYTVGTSFSARDLGTIQALKPNTQIHITRPDSGVSIGENAYVGIYRIRDYGFDWVTDAGTNSAGNANMYIESSTVTANYKYKVYINTPWQLRSEYASTWKDNGGAGYSLEELQTLSFPLALPQLKLTTLLPDSGAPNKWGWVSIEEVNSDNSVINWKTGDSLSYDGKASFILDPDKRYRLTVNPGPGKLGSATRCYIQTDSMTVVSVIPGQCDGTLVGTSLAITLNRGNVVGTILSADGVTPVVGAIIYANLVDAADDSTAVITCSTASGEWGMTLTPGLKWVIKILPVNTDENPVKLADLALNEFTPAGEKLILDATLLPK